MTHCSSSIRLSSKEGYLAMDSLLDLWKFQADSNHVIFGVSFEVIYSPSTYESKLKNQGFFPHYMLH